MVSTAGVRQIAMREIEFQRNRCNSNFFRGANQEYDAGSQGVDHELLSVGIRNECKQNDRSGVALETNLSQNGL